MLQDSGISSFLSKEVRAMRALFRVAVTLFFIVAAVPASVEAQTLQVPQGVGDQREATKLPAATQWTLEAAGPVQQAEINAVMLLVCTSTKMKGTGFLIDNGLVVTNNHVVSGCNADQMMGVTSAGVQIRFLKVTADPDVDLALLKPSQKMIGGLHLASGEKPPVGTSVSTWGYPLQFNGPTPLLSTGYIAGFIEDGIGAKKVKHLVINGAINPGNSGGPLFITGSDKVIGIVVAKFLPYSPYVQKAINVMSNNQNGFQYTGTDASGQSITMSEAQVVATVLQEFYNGTQVMIGEAISVSELKALLILKEAEMR